MADGEQMSDHFLDGCADLFSGKERAVRCAGHQSDDPRKMLS